MVDHIEVALRVRPLNSTESLHSNSTAIISYPSNNQILLGDNKSFTFDFIFDENSKQDFLFKSLVQSKISSFIQGYNVSIIAYGQTGSGKSYTMGTSSWGDLMDYNCNAEVGILPRAFNSIFESLESKNFENTTENSNNENQFTVKCTFIEIYNDDIVDLLDQINGRSKPIRITEIISNTEQQHSITVLGLDEITVNSPADMCRLLRMGASSRSTAATLMNSSSSRSHAIFTINLTQTTNNKEVLCSKFHFVDLAGSERLKRTNATGERMKEGININQGLLALGNVISALGDPKLKASHVPFRDSKITRILQDSLGGNSQTLMIACVSPADVNYEESLNTLKYANRAKNIQNKPIVNLDPNSAQISALNNRIKQLEEALRATGNSSGIISSTNVSESDNEIERLRQQNESLTQEVHRLEDICKERRKIEDEWSNDLVVARRESELAKLKIAKLSEFIKTNISNHLSIDQKQFEISSEDIEIVGNQSKKIVELTMELQRKQSEILDMKNEISKLKYNFFDDEKILQTNSHLQSIIAENEALKYDNKSLKRLSASFRSTEIPQVPHSIDFDSNHEDQSFNESEEESEDDENEIIQDQQDQIKNQEDEQNDIKRSLKYLEDEHSEKEKLVEELIRTRNQVMLMRSHYQQKIDHMEHEINSLQKEKEKAIVEMKNDNSELTIEQKEKIEMKFQTKIHAMEKELHQTKTKMQENNRLIALRAKDDQKIRSLQFSIDSIKQQKVNLMKQMRKAAEKHQKLLSEANRNIVNMTKKNRKAEIEVKTLQSKIQQQTTLLQRSKAEKKKLESNLKNLHKNSESVYSKSIPLEKLQNTLLQYLQLKNAQSEHSRLRKRKKELTEELTYHKTLIYRKENKYSQLKTRSKSHYDSEQLEKMLFQLQNEISLLKDREEGMSGQVELVQMQCLNHEEQIRKLGGIVFDSKVEKRSFEIREEKELMEKMNIRQLSDAKVVILWLAHQWIALSNKENSLKQKIKDLQSELASLRNEYNANKTRIEILNRDAESRIAKAEMNAERKFQDLILQLNTDSIENEATEKLKTELEEAREAQRLLNASVIIEPNYNESYDNNALQTKSSTHISSQKEVTNNNRILKTASKKTDRNDTFPARGTSVQDAKIIRKHDKFKQIDYLDPQSPSLKIPRRRFTSRNNGYSSDTSENTNQTARIKERKSRELENIRDTAAAALRKQQYKAKIKSIQEEDAEKRKLKAILLKNQYEQKNVPIFEKLSKTENYTGTQKVVFQEKNHRVKHNNKESIYSNPSRATMNLLNALNNSSENEKSNCDVSISNTKLHENNFCFSGLISDEARTKLKSAIENVNVNNNSEKTLPKMKQAVIENSRDNDLEANCDNILEAICVLKKIS